MFSLMCAWTNGWANSRDSGDLRRHVTQYDVTVMIALYCKLCKFLRSIANLRTQYEIPGKPSNCIFAVSCFDGNVFWLNLFQRNMIFLKYFHILLFFFFFYIKHWNIKKMHKRCSFGLIISVWWLNPPEHDVHQLYLVLCIASVFDVKQVSVRHEWLGQWCSHAITSHQYHIANLSSKRSYFDQIWQLFIKLTKL